MKPSELEVTHHTVDLPTLRMHFVSKGEGPMVVLLHGFPESWWSWRYQIDPLVNAGFRVVAPDLRGYGQTEVKGPYDIATLSDDVCRLITSLGESRARIVGHDWGGAVAWHLASHRHEFCERLAVLNCPHPVLMQRALLRKPSWEQLKKSWYFFFFQLPGLPEWLLTRDNAAAVAKMIKSASIDRAHTSEEELMPFRENIQQPGRATSMVNWYRSIVRDSIKGSQPYDDVTANTLLIWGMQDPALGFSDLVPGTDRFVPKLTIHQIPQAGHFVQSENPQAVNDALIPFLQAK